MTTYSQSSVRRTVVGLTIGSFSVAALMGVAALLGGGSFGEGEARVLLTTLVVGSASIVTLCYLATVETPYRRVGAIGGGVDLVAVVTALGLVWGDEYFDSGLVRTWGVATVLAATLAQICLLLALTAARRSLAPLLWTTIGLASVVAGIVSTMIASESVGDGALRLLGVVAILDVLGTVITVALGVFGTDRRPRMLGEVTVTLTRERSVSLRGEAARSGRSVEALVGEAVDRYVGSSAD